MSGIDWTELETENKGNALVVAKATKPIKIDNKHLPISGEELSTIPISGVKTTGLVKKATIPVTAVVEVVKTVVDIVDHAIQVYGQIAVEKERTKQIQAMASVQETLAREQTKQIEIQARERTAAIALQAKLECESKRMELKKFLMELDNEQHKREMSQETWRNIYQIVYDEIKSQNEKQNDIWQQMKNRNFDDDNLWQQFNNLNHERDKCLAQLISIGRESVTE